VRRTLACLLAALATLAGACNDDPKQAEPTPSPTPSVSLSPTPSPEQAELARLAGLTAKLRYDATYNFVAPATKDSGAIRIVAAPPYFRLDIGTGGTVAIFIVSPSRTVTCNIKGTEKSCFLVAGKGEEVPDLFDPGIQRLFSDAVRDLAANPLNYTVSTASPLDLPGKLPTGTCFEVSKEAGAPGGVGPEDPTGFETGRYCFARNGLLTSLAVSTGRMTLRKIDKVPALSAFNAVAPVKTLPKLPSPTPTPKRSASASASPSASTG
jgi:hypothetical protein